MATIKKEFKTHEEQLEVLESRGLVIKPEDQSLEILRKTNYYNLINGYKKPFLQIDTEDEKFIEGSSLLEIYSLYKFDRNIRSIYLEEVLKIEDTIKSAIAYSFSKEYGYEDKIYLNRNNFEDANGYENAEINDLISKLMRLIWRQDNVQPYIKHYREEHKYVPLWVLVIRYVLMLYIFFMILWGFNYSRISVAQMNGLESRLYSKTQLAELSSMLIQKANYQREIIKDEDLSKSAEKEYRVYIAAAQSRFVKLAEEIPQMGGVYGPPKPVISSPLMLYTGITGIYMPYTAEANVNISAPMLLFPSTLMHEMAHQRGIAPEDEANYIAYLASREMDDDIFRYSGTMLALIHSMNALNADDPQLAKKIRQGYSKQVNEDIRYYSAFWKKYEGRANDAADRINDTYLKVNNESDGVKSYGRMVDLLLAHYYQKGGL